MKNLIVSIYPSLIFLNIISLSKAARSQTTFPYKTAVGLFLTKFNISSLFSWLFICTISNRPTFPFTLSSIIEFTTLVFSSDK